MSFLIKDEEAWEKYEDTWYVIKNKLSIKFNSKPVYDKTYLKAKGREFNSKIKTNFWVMYCQKKIYIILALLVLLLILL